MANYATLKAAIAAAIRENGNNEITGNLLQQQLLAMVNSLGVGYQYAGIATPATNPGTPDQNVFYLASTAGTYTNFGGLVLADGEIAILKYNGAWSKDSTGAASLEKVNQLDQKLIKLKWIGTGFSHIPNAGDTMYRTDTKTLVTRMADDSVSIIPFYDGAIYTYENELYIWNGTDLILATDKIKELLMQKDSEIINMLNNAELNMLKNLNWESGSIDSSGNDEPLVFCVRTGYIISKDVLVVNFNVDSYVAKIRVYEYDKNKNLVKYQLISENESYTISTIGYIRFVAIKYTGAGDVITDPFPVSDATYINFVIESTVTDIYRMSVADLFKKITDCETILNQLYNKANNRQNGYYNTNGVWTSESAFESSEFIDISKYSIITYKNDSNLATAFIYGFYDANEQVIKSERDDKPTGAIIRKYPVPIGAKYFVFSTTHIESENNSVELYVDSELTKSTDYYHKLSGKKLSILGDSISTFAGWLPSGNQTHYDGTNDGVSSVLQTWWMRLLDATGMKLLVNNSWGGSSVSLNAPSSANGNRCIELDNVVEYPDVIIFFMGINDFRGSVPLGNYDGHSDVPESVATFSAAYAYTLRKMMNKYKNAKIFTCTLLCSDSVQESGFPDINNNNNTIADYNSVIKNISNALGAEVIDLNVCGITYWNMDVYMGDFASGKPLHPNADGQRLVFEKVLRELN